jgi:hypothetical protein
MYRQPSGVRRTIAALPLRRQAATLRAASPSMETWPNSIRSQEDIGPRCWSTTTTCGA